MRRRIPDEVLERHDVRVGSDNAFQREARLLQALWREQRGHPVGLHRGKPLGSRIEADFARDTLANFLTDGIRDVVRHAVLGAGRTSDQLIDEDRSSRTCSRASRCASTPSAKLRSTSISRPRCSGTSRRSASGA